MILSIGEILIDEFPDGRRIGGAPFNFAYHLRHLGAPVRFFSRVGDDADGARIREFLAARGFDLRDLQTDPQAATGRVRVELDAAGVPSFTIAADAAWDHLEAAPELQTALAAGPRLVYFGSLLQRTPRTREMLGRLLAQRPPATQAFCDVNLRAPWDDPAAIRACLEQTAILKLNTAELVAVTKALGLPPARDTDETVFALMAACGVSQVALTRGADGSSLYRGAEAWHAHPEPLADALADTVGAGDAFAAMLAAGLLAEWDPATLLRRATRFAAAVCTVSGALPAGDDFYRAFRLPETG